jgi:Holliday junction resolvasome RuvABC ATP-dependent DNA helicase subunit
MANFIGQTKIVKELGAIRGGLLRDKNRGINLLLRGPGGCGKTHLAKDFARNFGPFTIQWPEKGFRWDKECENERAHIVDEVHLLKIPEQMFRYMDDGRFIFILTTTEGGSLVEPLTSRCIEYNFSPYSVIDLATIIKNHATNRNFVITMDTAILIAERAKGSPRKAKQYLDRMFFIITQGQHALTLPGIESAFNEVGIFEGGYTELDMNYLSLLSKLEVASLNTIAKTMRLDKATIANDIEPFLISKGHITITGKGRKFLRWEAENSVQKRV